MLLTIPTFLNHAFRRASSSSLPTTSQTFRAALCLHKHSPVNTSYVSGPWESLTVSFPGGHVSPELNITTSGISLLYSHRVLPPQGSSAICRNIPPPPELPLPPTQGGEGERTTHRRRLFVSCGVTQIVAACGAH